MSGILRLKINSHKCCYNECTSNVALRVMPKKNRIEILKRHKLFISKKAVFCRDHLEVVGNSCRALAIDVFSQAQINEMRNLLKVKVSNPPPQVPEFKLSDYDIGISADNFYFLLNELKLLRSELKNEGKCKIALAMYLVRLRTGDFLYRIQKQFNISYETQKKYLTLARKSLMLDFAPLHLGLSSSRITRAKLIENSTEMANILFNPTNQVILIADASYIYYEKSSNYEIQRDTYNDQKKRNFVKPMVLTTPNGYYIDIFGPYRATTNDATILRHIFETFGPFLQLNCNDIFILDRGFRDVKQFLEEKGYQVKMPEFINKTDKSGQLTDVRANSSRMVTSCRFVIETRNGHIKEKFKIFQKTWITYEMPHLMDDYKIAAALINAFSGKIECNKGNAKQFAERMMQRAPLHNQFAKIVDRAQFQNVIKHFTEEDAETVNFPLFEPDDLKQFTMGSYQIQQAKSYVIEHLKRNGGFKIFKCPALYLNRFFSNLDCLPQCAQNTALYMCYMYSRFRKNSKHAVFVLISPSVNGKDGILSYCCDCRHGLRVVGCCSHVAAFISYMGMRHHRNRFKPVAQFMNNFFLG